MVVNIEVVGNREEIDKWMQMPDEWRRAIICELLSERQRETMKINLKNTISEPT